MSKKVKPINSLIARAAAGEPDAVRKVYQLVVKHGGLNAIQQSR